MADASKLEASEPLWRARAFEAAPNVAAGLAFAAGAFTLLAVATPALPPLRGLGALERVVNELPELSASIAGVALMGLATGLSRRIDAAWAATTALMCAIALYAALRHGHVALNEPRRALGHVASGVGRLAVGAWRTRESVFARRL